MNENKPLIFLTNDDGIEAPGLNYLIETVKDMGRLVVFAPCVSQSGKSSAITVDQPLRVINYPSKYENIEMKGVTGTPVDCVKLGLYLLGQERPALLLSGVNHGSNSSFNLIYSGTMGAVLEGCMAGIPSIGFSLLHHSWKADFSECGAVIRKIVGDVLKKDLPNDVCLNVNIPARCTPKGIKVTEASYGHWTEEYTPMVDPHGRTHYWLSGQFIDDDPDNINTDNYWLNQQFATVVPIRPDQTSHASIPVIKEILGL